MTDADHDLLIEISTNLKFVLDRQAKHEIDDASKHSVFEKDVKGVSSRIDRLALSGILSLIFLGITLWFKH